MSAQLREFEDIQWFIFRYSTLKAMPYSELGTHYMGSADREFYHQALRLHVTATAGLVKTREGITHYAQAAFPRMVNRGGEGFMDGPPSLRIFPNTALNRAKLYINLVAYMAGFPKEPGLCKLVLWLPPTLPEYDAPRLALHPATARYPFKYTPEKNFNPLNATAVAHEVLFNWQFVDNWLAYAQHHPDYCMTPEWEYRVIDYSK